jgi:hypothetical protein
MPFHQLARYKPGVSRTTHLFAAGLLWTAVGIMLIIRGWNASGGAMIPLTVGLVVGTAKSLLVLDRSALGSIDRILRLHDGACLGAVYSWKTWSLVLVMMASGILLRLFWTPGPVIGAIYLAVGWALLLSSRHGWRFWYQRLRSV